MLEAGATRSFWPAADLGGWRCCHEWAFGKPGILEGKRIGRLAGILRNAAKENLRQTPSGFAGQGSLWPAENPGGRRPWITLMLFWHVLEVGAVVSCQRILEAGVQYRLLAEGREFRAADHGLELYLARRA